MIYKWSPPSNGTIKKEPFVYVQEENAIPVPMPGARVKLMRVLGGTVDWSGVADATGRYHAEGLEVGVLYVPVAIDSRGRFECVASGPVRAESLYG